MTRRLLTRYAPALTGFATLVLLAALLESLIRAEWLDRFVVPLPSEVFGALSRILAEENVAGRFAATAGETLAAGVLAAVVAVPLAILLYRTRLLRAAYEPWIAAMAAAPIVLMYPLFLVAFGRSAMTIVLMASLAAMPPVVLKTLEGLSATRRVLLDVGRSMNLTQHQLFAKILFPSALATIFTGFRIGLIFALINIVGIEFLINFGGLGQLVNELAERYDLPGTYAAIVYVVLVSVLFFWVMERAERWLRHQA